MKNYSRFLELRWESKTGSRIKNWGANQKLGLESKIGARIGSCMGLRSAMLVKFVFEPRPNAGVLGGGVVCPARPPRPPYIIY